MRQLTEIIAAAQFLTRLPLRLQPDPPPDLARRAVTWYPLIGAGIGLYAAAIHAVARAAGLNGAAAALVTLAAAAWATGGLHEDGLADTADGFGGGRSREAKLAIMRDSRIGSYGVLALVFSVGLRAAALAALPGAAAGAALVAAGSLSRAGLPALARLLPPARPDGLGAGLGRISALRVVIALGLGVVVARLAAGADTVPAVAAACLGLGVVGLTARRHIGGHTGDVLGAAQQASEMLVLLSLSAVWGMGH
jgi:adenosylcobinamide-GDP ribazoletransferase